MTPNGEGCDSTHKHDSGDGPQNVADADLRRSITPFFSRNDTPYLDCDRDSSGRSSVMSNSSKMPCRICRNCRPPTHKKTFLRPLLYGLVAASIAYAIFQFLILDSGSPYSRDELFRIRRTIEDLTSGFHYAEEFRKKMQSDLKMIIHHLTKIPIFTDSTPAGARTGNQIAPSGLNDNAGVNLENLKHGENYVQNELSGNAHAELGNQKYGQNYAGTNLQKEKDDQNYAGVNIQNKKDDSTNLQNQLDNKINIGWNPQNKIDNQNYVGMTVRNEKDDLNYAGSNLQNKKYSQNYDGTNLQIKKEDSMNLQNKKDAKNHVAMNPQNENDGLNYTVSNLQNMKDSRDDTDLQNKKDAGMNLQNQEDGQKYVITNLQNENGSQKYARTNLQNKEDASKNHQNQNYVNKNLQNRNDVQNYDAMNIQKQEDGQSHAATNFQNKKDKQTYDGTNIQNKKDDSKTLQNRKDEHNYDAMNIPKQEDDQNYIATNLQNHNDDQNIADTNRQNQRSGQNYASVNHEGLKNVQNHVRNEYDGALRADFALETTGGRVVATGSTVPYNRYENKLSQILSMILNAICGPKYAAQAILQPSVHPGQCWAFSGSRGEVIIRLYGKVYCTGLTMEHIPAAKSPTGETISAPKDFTVKGLETAEDKTGCSFGSFTYDQNGIPNQYFPIINNCRKPYRYIKINFLTNWGNPVFTCIYRVQVHGRLAEDYDGQT